MLSRKQLFELINKDPPLIEGFIDVEKQVQVNGVDLTLASVERMTSAGQVDFDNSERKLPETVRVEPVNGWYELSPGSYKIVLNEVVHIPTNFMAIGRPRSSILRSGASIATAAWDGGYNGRSESLLVVYNPAGIRLKENARVLQLVFLPLKEETEAYSGIYQNENI